MASSSTWLMALTATLAFAGCPPSGGKAVPKTGSGSGSAAACVASCSAAITSGGVPCENSGLSQYGYLVSCTLGSCPTECQDLNQHELSMSQDCATCARQQCGEALQDCSNN